MPGLYLLLADSDAGEGQVSIFKSLSCILINHPSYQKGCSVTRARVYCSDDPDPSRHCWPEPGPNLIIPFLGILPQENNREWGANFAFKNVHWGFIYVSKKHKNNLKSNKREMVYPYNEIL